ncbi:hypothetical protein K431DRAFT_223896 [Polychaeton citri CBS 116435]|uniref:Amidohydrolase-related domain-containing protein n=1 Tax=Polychaeton citri CBS 116435 TaxID=1314669 RepID=A0A9P4Q6L3_9PEZI|nr:hypothetical protein K431DRAFT_223896 [Polychaeton citri CBS 116435]
MALCNNEETSRKGSTFCVTCDLLIPGKGKPWKDGCIVIEGGKIKHVGTKSDITLHFAHLESTHVKVLMPGMWDCHVHLLGMWKVAGSDFANAWQHMARSGARCARDVMLLLNAGFTSVREMAGFGIDMAQAIEEGTVPGPKIYSSNCIISMTGGHADLHDMPMSWFEDMHCHNLPMATADGVSECLKVVRKQLRAGAKVIKICGSGGVGSERDNPVDQQFSFEEVRAMVEEAERAQRIVGAHCHGKPGIMNSLRAGVKTIEHGSYIDEEAADLMLEKDAVLVATRKIVEDGLKLGKDMFTPIGYQKLVVTAEAQAKAYKIAVKKGVKCAIGTDTGVSIPGSKIVSQGLNGKELYYATQAGMTPLQAIEAATANGPLTLGPQAPKAGQLKEGYDADFIALDEDPLEDIEVLSGPDHVTHVWREGILYKWPGHPVNALDNM